MSSYVTRHGKTLRSVNGHTVCFNTILKALGIVLVQIQLYNAEDAVHGLWCWVIWFWLGYKNGYLLHFVCRCVSLMIVKVSSSWSMTHLLWYAHWNAVKFALDVAFGYLDSLLPGNAHFLLFCSQKWFCQTLKQISWHQVLWKGFEKFTKRGARDIKLNGGCTLHLFWFRLVVAALELKYI